MDVGSMSPLALLGGLALFALAAKWDDAREARWTRERMAEIDALDAGDEQERVRRMMWEMAAAEWKREATEQRRAERRAKTKARRTLRPARIVR